MADTKPKPSGVQCPLCKAELWDMDPSMIMTLPEPNPRAGHRTPVRCSGSLCKFSGYRLVQLPTE